MKARQDLPRMSAVGVFTFGGLEDRSLIVMDSQGIESMPIGDGVYPSFMQLGIVSCCRIDLQNLLFVTSERFFNFTLSSTRQIFQA